MDPPPATANDQPELDYILSNGASAQPATFTTKPPSATITTATATASSASAADADDDTSTAGAGAGEGGSNPKKRPLEDKKARDRKRILRNRQLARVSNERRKGRIKAMENELQETKQTVSTLEDSIRCLEEENRELRNLLQGKPSDGVQAATAAVTGGVAGAAQQTHGQLQAQGQVVDSSVIQPAPSVQPPG